MVDFAETTTQLGFVGDDFEAAINIHSHIAGVTAGVGFLRNGHAIILQHDKFGKTPGTRDIEFLYVNPNSSQPLIYKLTVNEGDGAYSEKHCIALEKTNSGWKKTMTKLSGEISVEECPGDELIGRSYIKESLMVLETALVEDDNKINPVTKMQMQNFLRDIDYEAMVTRPGYNKKKSSSPNR